MPTNETLPPEIGRCKSAEKEMQESERRYKELADSLPQTIFETDTAGNLIFANQMALRCFGYTQEDLYRGLTAMEMIAHEDRPKAQENFRMALSGEKLNDEHIMLRKDGSIFPAIIYASPISRNGRSLGLRGIVVDINERKKIEEAYMLSRNEAHRISKENEILAEIGRIVSSTLNIEEVYERFAAEAGESDNPGPDKDHGRGFGDGVGVDWLAANGCPVKGHPGIIGCIIPVRYSELKLVTARIRDSVARLNPAGVAASCTPAVL